MSIHPSSHLDLNLHCLAISRAYRELIAWTLRGVVSVQRYTRRWHHELGMPSLKRRGGGRCGGSDMAIRDSANDGKRAR